MTLKLKRDRPFIMVYVISEFDKDTWNVAASFCVNKELHTHTKPTPQKHVELLIRPEISLVAAPFKIFLDPPVR